MQKKAIKMIKTKTERRTYTVLITFLIFTAFLLSNILNLTVFKYEYYKNKTYDQITTSSKMRAERGNIYDANMNLLATTRTSWRIFISTRALKERTKKDNKEYARIISEGLAEALSLDESQLFEKISSSKQLDLTIKSSASEEEYKKVLSFINSKDLADIVFTEAQSSRYYPEGTLAAHVLGFTGSDNQGLYGLEYYYESTLRGKDGYYLYAKDASGNAMPGDYTTLIEPEAGCSLVTTIDSYLQRELEAQLEAIRINHSVTNRVTGIVMDTESGAILAMATSSPFDPNSPYVLDSVSQQILDSSGLVPGSEEYKARKTELMQIMWSNKAISETYEPGSTFKIVTVSAALDSGSAKMTDTFSCHGYHNVGGWRIKCHKVTGHGSGFSLAYGLQMSCNPTMMTIAERTGVETFYEYVQKFGYFEKTGIDLPSEASSIFHKIENMGSTELATASFGQRFKVSIIAQLTAVAAVANGGNLVTPYVVERVIDSEGNVVSEHETEIKRRVISESVAKEIAEVLEEGVSGSGGAKNAYVSGYSVAAKTGTSQKFDILDSAGNSFLRIGSTVAFAPSGESGIAVIIVVDEPQSTVKYGATVAAPYVGAFLSKALPYLEYEPSVSDSCLTLENYVGMNVKSAKELLNKQGISYEIVGDGTVVLSQSPGADIDISKDYSKIILYTEKREEEYVKIPNLLGLSLSEANILATNSGLNLKISGISDREGPGIEVTYQSLSPGDTVKRGTVIEIKILGVDFED